MPVPRRRHLMRPRLILLVLTASLLASPMERAFLLDQLSALLFPNDTLSKEGCGADPLGGCIPTRQTTAEAGCGADPLGLCVHSAPRRRVRNGPSRLSVGSGIKAEALIVAGSE